MKKYLLIVLLISATVVFAAPYGLNSRSVTLDGSADYLSITDASQTGLDITGDFSICAWMKINTLGISVVAGKWQSEGGNTRAYRFLYRHGSTRWEIVNSSDGTDPNTGRSDITDTRSANIWFHVCGVADVSATSGEVYINGESVGSATGIKTSNANTNSDFEVGATTITSELHDGLLDEVMVFDKVLTAEEVRYIYRREQKPEQFDANLQAYWTLNDSGNIRDLSGNDNTLTNNSSSVFTNDVPWTGVIPSGI